MNAQLFKKAGAVVGNLIVIGGLNVVGGQIQQETKTRSNELGKGARRSVEDKWMNIRDQRKNR